MGRGPGGVHCAGSDDSIGCLRQADVASHVADSGFLRSQYIGGRDSAEDD